jgi:glutamine synthetase
MHTNVSTQKMRDEGGIEHIKKAIYKLGARHAEHIAVYGEDNEKRLSGKYETANINQFSYGVANRGASIRIGRETDSEGKGFFEDRRPASNADPYLVTGKIFETITDDFDAPEIAPKDRDMAHTH